MFEGRRKRHSFISILVMVFIFVHSAMPGDLSSAESNIIVRFIALMVEVDSDFLGFLVRKMAHFTEYAVLGACLQVNVKDWMSLYNKKISSLRQVTIAWMLGTIYAVTDEFHQQFVPGRACAFLDVCIDSFGVLIGTIVVVVIFRFVCAKIQER